MSTERAPAPAGLTVAVGEEGVPPPLVVTPPHSRGIVRREERSTPTGSSAGTPPGRRPGLSAFRKVVNGKVVPMKRVIGAPRPVLPRPARTEEFRRAQSWAESHNLIFRVHKEELDDGSSPGLISVEQVADIQQICRMLGARARRAEPRPCVVSGACLRFARCREDADASCGARAPVGQGVGPLDTCQPLLRSCAPCDPLLIRSHVPPALQIPTNRSPLRRQTRTSPAR